MEDLRKIFKDLLQYKSKPKNKQEMIQTIQAIWNQVSLQQLQMLISNEPNKMQAIVLAKDDNIRW